MCSSKYRSMAALFRTFYFPRIFSGASNRRSKSAVNVVRTRPCKNSSANQRFFRPVDSVVVRTRPRAIPLAMIIMRKSTHGFPFVSHIWDAFGALLGGRSSAISEYFAVNKILLTTKYSVWSIILSEYFAVKDFSLTAKYSSV